MIPVYVYIAVAIIAILVLLLCVGTMIKVWVNKHIVLYTICTHDDTWGSAHSRLCFHCRRRSRSRQKKKLDSVLTTLFALWLHIAVTVFWLVVYFFAALASWFNQQRLLCRCHIQDWLLLVFVFVCQISCQLTPSTQCCGGVFLECSFLFNCLVFAWTLAGQLRLQRFYPLCLNQVYRDNALYVFLWVCQGLLMPRLLASFVLKCLNYNSEWHAKQCFCKCQRVFVQNMTKCLGYIEYYTKRTPPSLLYIVSS